MRTKAINFSATPRFAHSGALALVLAPALTAVGPLGPLGPLGLFLLCACLNAAAEGDFGHQFLALRLLERCGRGGLRPCIRFVRTVLVRLNRL